MNQKLIVSTMLFFLIGCVQPSQQPGESTTAANRKAVGVAAEGERIATELCGTCHQTPAREPDTDIGPPWAAIAANPDKSDQYIRDFLATPHWQMRRNYLSPQQIEDVIAYIRTLQA